MSAQPAERPDPLRELLRERFPDWHEVAREARNPVPAVITEDRRPYRRGGEGMTRLEVLLLQARAGRHNPKENP